MTDDDFNRKCAEVVMGWHARTEQGVNDPPYDTFVAWYTFDFFERGDIDWNPADVLDDMHEVEMRVRELQGEDIDGIGQKYIWALHGISDTSWIAMSTVAQRRAAIEAIWDEIERAVKA